MKATHHELANNSELLSKGSIPERSNRSFAECRPRGEHFHFTGSAMTILILYRSGRLSRVAG